MLVCWWDVKDFPLNWSVRLYNQQLYFFKKIDLFQWTNPPFYSFTYHLKCTTWEVDWCLLKFVQRKIRSYGQYSVDMYLLWIKKKSLSSLKLLQEGWFCHGIFRDNLGGLKYQNMKFFLQVCVFWPPKWWGEKVAYVVMLIRKCCLCKKGCIGKLVSQWYVYV